MSATAQYYRAVSAGAGIESVIGTHNDDASGRFSWTFGRNLTTTASGGYSHTQGLHATGTISGLHGDIGVTRQVGRVIAVSIDYSLIRQTSSLTLPTGALKGNTQTIAFSVAYHPREKHITNK